MDKICIDQKCVDGIRCSSDRDCSIGERCESDGTGGYCTDAAVELLGDMGIAPDGGLWTCNETSAPRDSDADRIQMQAVAQQIV